MINPVAFQLGSIAVRWYGIIMSIAVLLGIFLTLREAKRKGLDTEFFLDYFIYGIPAAVIGARLYYVIFQWELYQDNLLRIFDTRAGGLAIHGAIAGGLLALIIMTRIRDKSFWKVVDTLIPPLILGQAIGRWGNFINQEAHGGPVSEKYISYFPELIEKQMYIGGRYYHPTFLYESVWNLFVFSVLIYLRRKEEYIQNGDIFFGYLIGYSTGRFFIEGMRTDSLMIGPLKLAQLVSICLILIGILAIYIRHGRIKGKPGHGS